MLSFLLILFVTEAFSYNCTDQQFNPPANLSTVIYYPTGWNNSQTVPTFNPDQNCNFQINIPYGYFVLIMYSVNTTENNTVTVTDQLGQTEKLTSQNFLTYLWPKVSLTLVSKTKGQFSFYVHYQKAEAFNATQTSVKKGETNSQLISNSMVVNSTGRVSLVPFVSEANGLIISDVINMATVVFDGPNINSTYLGSFLSMASLKKNFVSSSKQLTIYQFSTFGNTFAILQDYSDVSDIVWHTAQGYYSFGSMFYASIVAANGKAAVYTVTQENVPEYLLSAPINIAATLSVYMGGPTSDNANRIVQYSGNDLSNWFPQQFHGTLRTYVLDKGTCVLKLSRNGFNSNDYYAYEGRRGFFSSLNYPLLSLKQSTTRNIYTGTSNKMVNFTWTVQDVAYGTAVQVSVTGGKDAFTHSYSSSKTSGSAIGTYMTVGYQTAVQSKGFFIEYEVLHTDSAGSIPLYFVSLAVLFLFS